MKTVLFLTYRMKPGFGVDVVVHRVSRLLMQRGHRVVIGCLEAEPGFDGVPIEIVRADAKELRALAQRIGADVIVAHTTPFFELLPELQPRFPCWAWEHGDPTPTLFDADRKERARMKERKTPVYAKISGVIAISDFIRHDIGFAKATVIYNGCDHVPRMDSKNQQDVAVGESRPLRVGTLMRLGAGEAFYKGNALFRQFAAELRKSQPNVELCVMGRGEEADARPFREAGVKVKLNASEADKWRYLRELDVFVSFSLWEGFNLPLIEAQAMGTVGLAFDTGAHPEVTPMVLGDLSEALAQVRAYSHDRELLLRHSRLCFHFVRGRFSWARCAADFERTVLTPKLPTTAGAASGKRATLAAT